MDQGGFGGHRQLVPCQASCQSVKGAGADPADPGLDQYLLAVEQLPFELHRVARDDQMPVVHIQLGEKMRNSGSRADSNQTAGTVLLMGRGHLSLENGVDLHFQHGYRLLVVGPRSG